MDGNTVEDNYRPTQELNSRTVYYHDAMGEWINLRKINIILFFLSSLIFVSWRRRRWRGGCVCWKSDQWFGLPGNCRMGWGLLLWRLLYLWTLARLSWRWKLWYGLNLKNCRALSKRCNLPWMYPILTDYLDYQSENNTWDLAGAQRCQALCEVQCI